MNWFCKIGIHRDLIQEERTYSRIVTDHGETIDSQETKTCRCGFVIESKSQSSHESTITQPGQEGQQAAANAVRVADPSAEKAS